MYRTARAAIYDVLDAVFVNVTVTEYDGTPGASATREFVYSTSIPSHGDYDAQVWVRRALEGLLETLT